MDMEPSEQEQRQHLREAEAEIFATNNRTSSRGEAYVVKPTLGRGGAHCSQMISKFLL